MKCEIRSWEDKEVECDKKPTIGDCANCIFAWSYMSLDGPGSFSAKLEQYNVVKEGKDLVARVKFNNGDPKIYTCSIRNGVYLHLQESK